MNSDRLNYIKEKLSAYNVEYYDVNGDPGVITVPENVVQVCTVLKNDSGILFEQCRDVISVDRFEKENRFEVIYSLYSLTHKDRLFVKVILDTKNPSTPSLTVIWRSVNWYEREAYDMMGITFENHPDHRRIYMPEEFKYYPLRKDFPLMGIPGSLELPKK